MKNEFRICNRCQGTSVSSLVPQLESLDPTATIKIGCQNFCGIGRTKSFAIVNHIPIIADDEDQLITKIEAFLRDHQ